MVNVQFEDRVLLIFLGGLISFKLIRFDLNLIVIRNEIKN